MSQRPGACRLVSKTRRGDRVAANEVNQNENKKEHTMSPLPSKVPHVVILGGGYAGVLSALRLAGRAPARITLVNAVPHFVERIRLHQLAAAQPLVHRPLAAMLRGTGVELLIGRVAAIEAREQRLLLELPDHSTQRLAWDYLLYAAGSGASGADLAGAAEHACTVANEPGARQLAARLAKLADGARVAVIGGGLTGIETASELAESYPRLRVALLSAQPIGPSLSAGGRAYVRATLQRLGVELREGQTVQAIERDALTVDKGCFPAAVAVVCGGFRPSGLAAAAGLAVNAAGQLQVDPLLRAPAQPHIFACGDGASVTGIGVGLRMACATAMPMAAHAADNLAALLTGRPLRPHQFRYAAQCVSLGRRRGILQRVAPDDAPRSFIVTERMGARLKEAICRFTTLTLAIERRFGGTYRWPGRAGEQKIAAEPALLS
jgi:NADH dehydrogenase FAD-containing subunit